MWIRSADDRYINIDTLTMMAVENYDYEDERCKICAIGHEGDSYLLLPPTSSRREAQAILDKLMNKIHDGEKVVDILEVWAEVYHEDED